MVSMTVSPGGQGLGGRLERAVSAFAAVPVGLRPDEAADRIRWLHRLRARLVDFASDAGDLPQRVRSKAAVTLTVGVETLLGLPGAGPLLDRLGVTPSQIARRLPTSAQARSTHRRTTVGATLASTTPQPVLGVVAAPRSPSRGWHSRARRP